MFGLKTVDQLLSRLCFFLTIPLVIFWVEEGQSASPVLEPIPFARDDMIFDSGAARGDDAAVVPLSGYAEPGAVVEARFRPDAGEAGPWHVVGASNTFGVWQGQLAHLSRTAGWGRVDLRLANLPEKVVTTSRVAAGHVVAIWGQSELHRAVLPTHAALKHVPEVRNAQALQVTYSLSAQSDYGQIEQFRHIRVQNASPVSAHMAALSNLFDKVAPGEPFHLLFQTKAGTGLQQLLNDDAPKRLWADDLALQRFALPNGGLPGLAWISWYNSDASLGPHYGQVLFAALTGRNMDGTPLIIGNVPLGGRFPMHHSFAELYGPKTIWAVAGPHRFEMDAFDDHIAACRAAVNDMFASGKLPGHIRRALEPLTYLNGNPQWRGDYSHPDTLAQPRQGMTKLMLLMGNSILRQLGLVAWLVPEFDKARVIDQGRRVEVWSSAGPVTSTRIAQNEPAVPGRPAIASFVINGQAARFVSLRNGRIQIQYDQQGNLFPAGTTLGFGVDGIGSQDLEADVREHQIWKDYPIVDVGQTDLPGIPVRAQPRPEVLAVLPKGADPRDAALSGDLLPAPMQRFVPTEGKSAGWLVKGQGWRLLPSQRLATAALTAKGTLSAISPRRSMEHLQGKNLELSFVAEMTGGAPEYLLVTVAATGGGATELFSREFKVVSGKRMVLELERYPRNRDALLIVIRRRGVPSGELTIGSLSLTSAD